MAYFDDRIGPREMQRERAWRRYARENDDAEGEGFRRRGGWREGSDYYGNRPERFEGGGDERGFGRTFDYSGEQSQHRPAGRFDPERWRADQDEYGAWGSLAGALGIGQRENHRGRGPRGFKRSDNRIHDDVCDCLTEDGAVDATNVEVIVQDGEVTLSGSVNSRLEKRRAEDLVERITGVRDVHNRLRVGSEGGRIEPSADVTGAQTQSGSVRGQIR